MAGLRPTFFLGDVIRAFLVCRRWFGTVFGVEFELLFELPYPFLQLGVFFPEGAYFC